MEQILHFFENYGLWGLFFLSFLESFISPILPDIMLIPMVLSMPEEAIYYSAIATLASVLGGFIGYGIGSEFGQLALKKYVPPRHTETIERWIKTYGGWAILLGALAPIPYKFVCIAAGTFRTNILVFLIASILGRGKRFLLLGILIFYYGPKALDILDRIPDRWILIVLGSIVTSAAALYYLRYRRQLQSNN
jgi:membrane protein YqaA with SNARE-associated domain